MGQYSGFRIILCTREQVLKLEKTKVTLLQCNVKDCRFYLDFRSNKDSSNEYKLFQHWNKHNHELELKDGSLEITPEILTSLKELRCVTKDVIKISKNINEKFDKKFTPQAIRYQLSKLKNEEYGNPAQDAHELITLLENDKRKRNIFFTKKLSAENQLEHFFFMTRRMIELANKFSDVFICDTTFKTNRFGMPLLDIICINNLGKSCTVFVALIANSKFESFKWALSEFEKNLRVKPKIIFSDEEEALRKSK